MLNVAVFASTKGTDLQEIIDELKSGKLEGVNLKFVLSNKQMHMRLNVLGRQDLKPSSLTPRARRVRNTTQNA